MLHSICFFYLSHSSICKIESYLLYSHCKRKRTSHLTSSPWPPPTHPPKVIRGTNLSLYKERAGGKGCCVQNTRLWKCICWAGREFGVRRSSARRQDWCPPSGNNSLSLLYSSCLLNNRARKMHNVIDTYSSWSTILKWEAFSISIDLICKEY